MVVFHNNRISNPTLTLRKMINIFKKIKSTLYRLIFIIQKTVYGAISACYQRLNAMPRYKSIPIFIIGALVWILVGLLIFLFTYELFFWGSYKSLVALYPHIPLYMGTIWAHWIQLFRECWLWSSMAYGPLPAYQMFYYTLVSYKEEHLALLVWHVLLIAFLVLSVQCLGLMLGGLIFKKKNLGLRINGLYTLLGMCVVTILLLVFVLCSPVFGWGLEPSAFPNVLHPWQDVLDARERELQEYLQALPESEEEVANALGGFPMALLIKSFAFLNIICLLYWCYVHVCKQVQNLGNPKQPRGLAIVKISFFGLGSICGLVALYALLWEPMWYQELIHHIDTWVQELINSVLLKLHGLIKTAPQPGANPCSGRGASKPSMASPSKRSGSEEFLLI